MLRQKLRTDFLLGLCVIALTAIGLFALYSATYTEGMRRFAVQSFSVCLGLILYIALAFFHLLGRKKLFGALYGFTVLVLFFVAFFGSGKESHGASSWIRIGGIGLQPSEPAKIVFALFFAKLSERYAEQNTLNQPKNLLFLSLVFLAVLIPVILQNDTGTALVFLFMFFVMLYISGLSKKYILGGLFLALISLPLIWLMLSGYQKERILTFLNPARDALGAGFQVAQSKLTIGSGMFFGRGFMMGPQTRVDMLPESETDFIFAVISEEFGFLGAAFTAGLLFLLVFRIFHIAKCAHAKEAQLITVGIGAFMLFHILENISMCLGLLPVTGIPLPFLSYGGSAMITNYAAIGVISNIYRNNL